MVKFNGRVDSEITLLTKKKKRLTSCYLACLDSLENWKGKKEMFYLTTHSTHFIYGYMASDIW